MGKRFALALYKSLNTTLKITSHFTCLRPSISSIDRNSNCIQYLKNSHEYRLNGKILIEMVKSNSTKPPTYCDISRRVKRVFEIISRAKIQCCCTIPFVVLLQSRLRVCHTLLFILQLSLNVVGDTGLVVGTDRLAEDEEDVAGGDASLHEGPLARGLAGLAVENGAVGLVVRAGEDGGALVVDEGVGVDGAEVVVGDALRDGGLELVRVEQVLVDVALERDADVVVVGAHEVGLVAGRHKARRGEGADRGAGHGALGRGAVDIEGAVVLLEEVSD